MSLPTVSDPDRVYADLTRREYQDFVANFRDFELDLIDQARTDTSLIDQAREDAPQAAQLTQEIQQRNLERYGVNLTGQQRRQMDRSLQRGNTLGAIQSVNDARIRQEQNNLALLGDLVNIGQDVNRVSQNQLAQSAQNAVSLKNAYAKARAQSKAQTYQTIAGIGSAAIFALAI